MTGGKTLREVAGAGAEDEFEDEGFEDEGFEVEGSREENLRSSSSRCPASEQNVMYRSTILV